MIRLPAAELRSCVRLAEDNYPIEASGLLIAQGEGRAARLRIVATSMRENTRLSFVIRASTIERVARACEVEGARLCGCFHSHCFAGAGPSPTDLLIARRCSPELNFWLIYSVPTKHLRLYRLEDGEFFRHGLRVLG